MIEFTKMHGLGNDFMVIDAIHQDIELTPQRIAAWADRHTGVGFDQLLVVEEPQGNEAEFRYRIFNADGGEVEQCGNGARCFARFVRDRGLSQSDRIPVETRGGLIELQLLDDGRVRVDMGRPRFDPAEIPLDAPTEQDRYRLEIDGESIEFGAVSMGNPHAVLRVEDVDRAAVGKLGPLIESHPLFPQRVNVGFLQIVDRAHFRLRVYERGVGETRACGTGACAAMAVGRRWGLLDARARAELRGGELLLDWPGGEAPVMMTGEAVPVYDGRLRAPE